MDGDVLAALAGRRVLIAGASGFVGGWLLAALAWLNRRAPRPIAVTGISRSPVAFDAPWFTAVTADLRAAPAPPAADFVVHAAMSSEASPVGGEAAIRDTARAGATWAADAARGGARVLALSSGAVEGSTDAYAEAKRGLERDLAAAARTGAAVAIARVFTCIGPGYRAHQHLAHVTLFDDARRGGPLRLRSDGRAVRSYLYGGDVAAWLLRGVVHAEPGEVFAVGSPEPIEVLDLAHCIARVAGLPASSVLTGAAATGARTRYIPSLGDAHRRMGLDVWTPLDVAVARTLELWPGPVA